MPTRGRPQTLPWDEEIDALVTFRQQGATWQDLVEYLADKYGQRVASQTVRHHVRDALGENTAPAPAPPVNTGSQDASMKEKIYAWLQRHPASSIDDIATGTGLPRDAVVALHETVKNENRGYVIVPLRSRKEKFTDTELHDALADAMDSLGLREEDSISRLQYDAWRRALPDSERDLYPSTLTYRRRYGTWGDAVEAAGLPRNEKHREYEGLTRDDVLLWLAHFLRDMKNSHDYMVEATEAEYRGWVRNNPEAPSAELLRIKGLFGQLLVDAAEIERTTRNLPPGKPVNILGRKKKQPAALFREPAAV